MSRRPEQLASVLHRAVQAVIEQGLADPRLQAMITVTGVKVSTDFRDATVHVTVAPQKKESLAIHALTDASGFIRRRAADLADIHACPRLAFKLDKALKRQSAVLQALAEVAAERPAATDGPTHQSAEPAPGPDASPGLPCPPIPEPNP